MRKISDLLHITKGNVYLIALATTPANEFNEIEPIGIAVYKSQNEGRTWSNPKLIHLSSGDDKQWAAGDVNNGNVYAVWGDGYHKLAFARTSDHGTTWKGIKIAGMDQPAGTPLPNISDSGPHGAAPELSVAADGTIYIVWQGLGEMVNEYYKPAIKFVKSIDGGESFSPS